MKQCISKVLHLFTYLWRTLKAYVQKLKHKCYVRVEDVDSDGNAEIVIDPDGEGESIKGGK